MKIQMNSYKGFTLYRQSIGIDFNTHANYEFMGGALCAINEHMARVAARVRRYCASLQSSRFGSPNEVRHIFKI